MVLTDRQRADLHAGIYEYLTTLEGGFQEAAKAFAEADPVAASSVVTNGRKNGAIPLLEKKWTAIPRLQKKVLELERQAAHNAQIHAHRTGAADGSSTGRRMLPRLPCTHTLQGHAASVTCLALHPVYTMVVSGSEDGTIKCWDHESGEYLRTLKGHTNTVHSVAFSPTGSHLVSCSSDLGIKLWDLANYTCVRTLRGHDHTISSVRFLPPPSTESTLSTSTPSGENPSSSTGLEMSVTGAAFVLSASRDATVKLWDLETGFCEHTYQDHNEWVRCLAVRPGQWASAGNDHIIMVHEYKEKKVAVELRGHEHVVETLAFLTEDHRPSVTKKQRPQNADATDYLVSGARDRTVRLWRLASASCVAVFNAHENWVRSVILHPSGQYVISSSDDKTIRVFDIKAQRCLRTLEPAHDHFVTSIDMHPTLPILVSSSVDATIRCWTLD
mmetsp:Transcript_11717/g.22460  ORF Transcript_11717/g.22460 Transcript_11717/m.22460 type:complete len:443 (+) Transcript_11717:385-1713(+)